MLTPEEKFLIAVYGEKVFGGGFVRQSMPSCCGRVIDLEKISAVKFIDIEVEWKQGDSDYASLSFMWKLGNSHLQYSELVSRKITR